MVKNTCDFSTKTAILAEIFNTKNRKLIQDLAALNLATLFEQAPKETMDAEQIKNLLLTFEHVKISSEDVQKILNENLSLSVKALCEMSDNPTTHTKLAKFIQENANALHLPAIKKLLTNQSAVDPVQSAKACAFLDSVITANEATHSSKTQLPASKQITNFMLSKLLPKPKAITNQAAVDAKNIPEKTKHKR